MADHVNFKPKKKICLKDIRMHHLMLRASCVSWFVRFLRPFENERHAKNPQMLTSKTPNAFSCLIIANIIKHVFFFNKKVKLRLRKILVFSAKQQ